MKIFFSLFALVLGLAYGQNPPPSGPDSPTSKSDFASKSVFDRLAAEVAKRSGHPDDLTAIGRKPLRIVFLVDSSQNSAKDYLPPFEQKVVAGILRKIGNAQLNANMADDGLDDVSIYPYQLKLIEDSDKVSKNQILKKGEGTVLTITKHIPLRRIPVKGEGELGHDSGGARRALIDDLGLANGPRSTVIIQLTPTLVNSDPDNAENNKKIIKVDARSGQLQGTDYVVYDDDGRYYQTDPPGSGISPSDVHIWTYGPAQFDVPAAKQDGQISHGSTTADDSSPNGLFAILGILVVMVGYVVYRYTLKIPVEMDGEIRKAGFTRPVAIQTAGGKPGEHVLHISPERRGSVGEGLKVGQVTVPLLFGGPRIGGGGGHTLFLNNSSKSELLLRDKPVSVSFGKGDARTELISFKIK